jgi:hypothetical protein
MRRGAIPDALQLGVLTACHAKNTAPVPVLYVFVCLSVCLFVYTWHRFPGPIMACKPEQP